MKQQLYVSLENVEKSAACFEAVINGLRQGQAVLRFYVLSLGNIWFTKPNFAFVVLKSAVTLCYFLFFYRFFSCLPALAAQLGG